MMQRSMFLADGAAASLQGSWSVMSLLFCLRNWPEESAEDPDTGPGFSTRGAPAPKNPHPLTATIPRGARMEKVKAKTSRIYRSSCDALKRTSTSRPNAGRRSPARGGQLLTR